MPSAIDQQLDALRSSNRTLELISNTLTHILKTLNEIDEHIEHGEKIARESLETQREVLDQSKAQTIILQQLLEDLAPEPPLTASAPVIIPGESMANNTYQMNVGQSQAGVITPLLADGVTPSGGTVSGTVVTFNDPSASFVLAADNVTITFTGLAANTAPVSGSVDFTVVDSDGVTSTWTDAITVEVDAVAPPPQQLTQSAPIVVGVATP